MTAPGGTPGLPSGSVLTIDNIESRLQDMTPGAMKSRAVNWFPNLASTTTGGDPAGTLSPFGVLTGIWSRWNSTVANADPAAVKSVADLGPLFTEFVENLPVVGTFVKLFEAFAGNYTGTDPTLVAIQNLFGTIPKLINNLLSGAWIPQLDASKIGTGTFLSSLIPTLDASKIGTGTFLASLIPGLDASKITSGTFGQSMVAGLTTTLAGLLPKSFWDAVNVRSSNMIADPDVTNPTLWGAGNISTEQSFTGTTSYKITVAVAGNYNGFLVPRDSSGAVTTWPVQAGERYYVEGWVRANAGNATIKNAYAQAQFIDSKGVNTQLYSAVGTQVTPVTNGFVKVGGVITVPAGYDSMQMGFWTLNNDTVGSSYYWDRLLVREETQARNLLNTLFGSPTSTATAIQSAAVPALDASKIGSGTFLASLIPGLDASKITTGSLDMSRVSGLVNAFTGIDLTSDTPIVDYVEDGLNYLSNYVLGSTAADIANLYSVIISAMSGNGGGLLDVLAALKAIPGPNIATLLLASIIPGLDGSKIISGTIGQSFLSITNIAANIISGILGTGQIPALDASKITSGQFAQSFVNITSIAAGIISGVLNTSNVPALDASKIGTGTFADGFLPGLVSTRDAIYQAINGGTTTGVTAAQVKTALGNIPGANIISAIAAAIIPALDASKVTTGTFGTGLIPNLAASKITSGTLATAQIPALPASQITSGTFTTGLIPSLAASIITSGVFGTGLIPALDASKIGTGTFADGFLPGLGTIRDSIYQAIYGGTTTGVTAAQVKTGLQNFPGGNIVSAILASIVPALDASKITTGAFGASLIPALDAAKIATGTFLSGLIPSLDASKLTSGTLLTSIIPALDASKVATGTFTASQIPTIDASKVATGTLGIAQVPTSSISLSNTPVIQSISDYIAQAFFGDDGYSGTALSQAKNAMATIRQQLTEHSRQIQSLQSQQAAGNNSGINVNINFANYPDGPLTQAGFTVTYLPGSGTATVGIKNGVSCWDYTPNDGDRTALVVHDTPSVTDFQIIRGTMSNPPAYNTNGTNPVIYGIGHVDSLSNPQNYIWYRAYATGFMTWKADIGCVKAGVLYVWQSGISMGWNTNTFMVVGVNGNPNRHQLWSGTTLVKDYTETAGQSGGLSNTGAGFRLWGARSEIKNGSPGASNPGTISGCSISDNALPTTVGSFFRAYRQSTSASTAVGVSSTPVITPTGTYDTVERRSADLTWDGQGLTVSKAGAYNVEMQWDNPAAQLNGAKVRQGFMVKPAGGSYSLVRQGPAFYQQQAANQTQFAFAANLYLNAGDTVAPARASSNTSTTVRGDAAGLLSYFTVANTNFSLN